MKMQFQNLRQRMVDCQIRPVGVTDLKLLESFLLVKRENFVPEKFLDLAYAEEEILIHNSKGNKRYMMRPASLAKMLQLLNLKKTDIILIIGAGTGYSAAICSHCVYSVIALEENEDLLETTKNNLLKNGISSVSVVSNPLIEGYPTAAPYDTIFIEGRVEEVPQSILNQLKNSGKLVAVNGSHNFSTAKIYKQENDSLSEYESFFVPVPLLTKFKKKSHFHI